MRPAELVSASTQNITRIGKVLTVYSQNDFSGGKVLAGIARRGSFVYSKSFFG